MEKLIINKLPTRTWNRLGVNEAAIEWNTADAEKLPEESISLSAAEKKTAHIAVRGESEHAEKTVTLTVAPGGELTVYEDIAAANKLAVRTDIILGENAKLRLVQVQSAVEGGIARSAITADCADGAGVELVQILLGAGDVYTDCLTELRGDASSFKADVGYIARGTQKIDVNLVCNHYGKHTESEIAANGALMDLGVYAMNFMTGLFGKPESLTASAVKLHNGVDGVGSSFASCRYFRPSLADWLKISAPFCSVRLRSFATHSICGLM